MVQPGTEIATISIMDMYTNLYANYVQVTEGDLEESRSGITAQFDFATLPMEQYLFKVQKCQQLHGNALPTRPITDMEATGDSISKSKKVRIIPIRLQGMGDETVRSQDVPKPAKIICRSRTPPKGK